MLVPMSTPPAERVAQLVNYLTDLPQYAEYVRLLQAGQQYWPFLGRYVWLPTEEFTQRDLTSLLWYGLHDFYKQIDPNGNMYPLFEQSFEGKQFAESLVKPTFLLWKRAAADAQTNQRLMAQMVAEMGISQAVVAERIGASPAYVSALLKGKNALSDAKLQEIARALGYQVTHVKLLERL